MNVKPDAHPWAVGMPVFCQGWDEQQVIIALTPGLIILRSGERYHRSTGFRVGDFFFWGRAAIHPDTPEAEQYRYEVSERRRLTTLVHNACFHQDVTIEILVEALATLRPKKATADIEAGLIDTEGGSW